MVAARYQNILFICETVDAHLFSAEIGRIALRLLTMLSRSVSKEWCYTIWRARSSSALQQERMRRRSCFICLTNLMLGLVDDGDNCGDDDGRVLILIFPKRELKGRHARSLNTKHNGSNQLSTNADM